MNLNSSIQEIKGIGDKTAKLFAKIGVYTLGDILLHFPRTYEQFPSPVSPTELQGEGMTAVCGCLRTPPLVRKGRSMEITTATAFSLTGDSADALELVWFRMPYLRSQLKSGIPYIFYGRLSLEGRRYKMEQSSVYTPEQYGRLQDSLQPVYPLTRGLTNQMIRKSIKAVLQNVDVPEDDIPPEICEREAFLPAKMTYQCIHFPNDMDEFLLARKRLVYREFFYFLLCSRMQQQHQGAVTNEWVLPNMSQYDAVNDVLSKLSFSLTRGQQETLEALRRDLRGPVISQRLIQGDVGSGKTIVAFLAMLDVISAGYQAAIMAPTEVLARQHAKSFEEMIQEFGLPYGVVCLVGSMTAKEKREAKSRIASEDGLFIVGTHALIQENVNYHSLALVITDEQHRFGVRQRELLAEKGQNPHMVVMSATPIPRTLAMILYSNMRISVIRELPANRLPIKTCVIKTDKRETAYQFIARELMAGHQAYIICPLVEASDKTEAENVTEYAKKIRSFFPNQIAISVLHGKMKPTEKNAVMEDFAKKSIHILVSTTVVEVGINVPNATVMMIENADRFGLAALHQLRGRVGRGEDQSYCILMDNGRDQKISKRLEILNQSSDGFYIAEQDLKLRGPGDLFGVRQSGDLNFRIADVIQDAQELTRVSEDVDQILSDDPDLAAHPGLRENACRFMEENSYIL